MDALVLSFNAWRRTLYGPKLARGPVRRSEARTVGGAQESLADQSETGEI